MVTPSQCLAKAAQWIPKSLRDTLTIRAFGATKVPLILYCMPTVKRLDAEGCDLMIPLSWRTRNHYKSMYFGVLAIGADCTAGLLAMHLSEQAKGVNLLFKDFKADFHKRAVGDVVFRCDDGVKIQDMVARCITSGQRINEPVHISAHVPSDNDAHVASMVLTLSLKQYPSQTKTPH